MFFCLSKKFYLVEYVQQKWNPKKCCWKYQKSKLFTIEKVENKKRPTYGKLFIFTYSKTFGSERFKFWLKTDEVVTFFSIRRRDWIKRRTCFVPCFQVEEGRPLRPFSKSYLFGISDLHPSRSKNIRAPFESYCSTRVDRKSTLLFMGRSALSFTMQSDVLDSKKEVKKDSLKWAGVLFRFINVGSWNVSH